MLRYLRNFFFAITSPGVRFRSGDNPTQNTFMQLFQSAAFIREKSDTAKLNEQGLAKCTEDVQCSNRDSTEGPDLMTRFVKAHQLPNVIENTGIAVEEIVSSAGRVGGQGKDFMIRNKHVFIANSPLVLITNTNAATGNIEHNFYVDFAALQNNESGRIKIGPGDTTPGFPAFKLISGSPNLLVQQINVNAAEQLVFTPKDKVGEIRQFFGLISTFPAVGDGRYNNTPGSQWRGWALCTGETHNGILTPDLRGRVAIGYNEKVFVGPDANPLYTTLGAFTDAAVVAGKNKHALTKPELPPHKHHVDTGGGTIAISASGAHTHSYVNWPNLADIGDGGTTATVNDTATNQITGSNTHTHANGDFTGEVGDGSHDTLASVAHENRQPFTVLAHVMYCGY